MPKFLNNLICSAMIFALSFLWIYYCTKSVFWAVSLALVIALCSAYLIYRIQNKMGQIKHVKAQNKKAVTNLHDYLKYNDDNANLFAELYRYYHYDITPVDPDCFIAEKDGVSTFILTAYCKDSLSSSDVAQAIVQAKRHKADKLRIYASKTDSVALQNAKLHFNVEFADLNSTYELFVQADKLPELPEVKPVKSSFVAKYAFCRKRFGWYFASSIFMTLLSLVAYFPYYLLGWATVMLGLALYSMFNTRYNVSNTVIEL